MIIMGLEPIEITAKRAYRFALCRANVPYLLIDEFINNNVQSIYQFIQMVRISTASITDNTCC